MNRLNIEDQDKLDRHCGDCGYVLDESNRSDWFAFFGDGKIQIELCATCNSVRASSSDNQKTA